jgi:hypothetical protein
MLSGDKNEIFRAARDAEQITEYVIALDRERAQTRVLAPHAERARAFDQLPEREAVAQHPELSSLYEGWHRIERALEVRFPDDAVSRDKYLTAVRLGIVQRLNAGERLIARAIKNDTRTAERHSVPHQHVSASSVDLER